MKTSFRKTLKYLVGQRLAFTATVSRYGKKNAFRGEAINTVLLVNIRRIDTGEVVTDHLWFTVGKVWMGFKPGDQVTFDARVGDYRKGYFGRREEVYVKSATDYRLERPTKVYCVGRAAKNKAKKSIGSYL